MTKKGVRIQRQFFFALWIFLLFIGAILFFWTFRSVPFGEIVGVLSGLHVWQIIVLLAVNMVILLIAPLRWWLILKIQGHNLPYLALARYRFEGSAVSYFTPGQNFGGEPLQVNSLRKRHGVKGSTGLASVSLDRAIELIANSTVLLGGIGFALASGLAGIEFKGAAVVALAMLIVLVAYLASLGKGFLPFKRISSRFEGRLFGGLRAAEDQLGILIHRHPMLFVEGLACSALIWVTLFFEFWLALKFLGLPLNLLQLVVVVTAGRVALLAPTPGALGVLEASQMLALQALGFDPAYGLGLGLLIRARDILFAITGLISGAIGLR